MDLFPSRERGDAGPVDEDLIVFFDGSASQGGLEAALADVTGINRMATKKSHEDLSVSLDTRLAARDQELIIIEIEPATSAAPTPRSQSASPWLRWAALGTIIAVVLVGLGWYLRRMAR